MQGSVAREGVRLLLVILIYEGTLYSLGMLISGTLLPGNMICREGLTRVFGHSVPSPCLCQIEPDAIGNHLVVSRAVFWKISSSSLQEILRSYESGYVRSSYTVRATDDGPHAFSESTILLELDVSLWRKIAMVKSADDFYSPDIFATD